MRRKAEIHLQPNADVDHRYLFSTNTAAETGDSEFNSRLDAIFRALHERLVRFNSTEACGRWNANLIDDIRSDVTFIRHVEDFFSVAVTRYACGANVTSDGLSLQSAKIVVSVSIDLYFRLDFLDTPLGYAMAPAKLSVVADTNDRRCFLATLAFGSNKPKGNFWYPKSTPVFFDATPDDDDWAYRQCRLYGPPTISSWLGRNRRTQEGL